MTKICEQTNVAQTDDSAVACEQLTSSDCIIYSDAIAYLNLPENSSVTDIIAAMMLSLIDARSRIAALEA